MLETKTVKLPVTLPKGFEECARCADRLHDSMLQIEGMRSVEINPRTSTMSLTYDPYLTSIEDVEKRAHNIGVELREKFEHKALTLIGLDCPDCAIKIEKTVSRLNGVLWVSTSYAAAKFLVEYDPSKIDFSTIEKQVRRMGYRLAEKEFAPEISPDAERIAPPKLPAYSIQTRLTVISGFTLAVALILAVGGFFAPSNAMFVVAAVSGGVFAVRGAWYSLRAFALDTNFLMSAAAIGAIAIGEYLDAAMVMFLFSLGGALEARTVDRARDSVRTLVNLFPTQARVKRNGQEVIIPAGEIEIGEEFIVRPGEKIPTDGVILAGGTAVNQASITGESAPVEKLPGDTVFAGSINHQGSIDVRATASARDNTLARILHLVEEAQAEKGPSQRFTEIFGRRYTPLVIGLALAIAVLWPPIFGMEFQHSLYMALTLLVVACPCALVIGAPVAIVSGIGNAARHGVLIKGGSHLETAGNVNVIAFDKTGTITTGEAKVTDIITAEGFTQDQVLELAASVESRSEHPLAEAIMREASKRNIGIRDIADFQALVGMGAAAKFDDETCVIGNSRLMEQLDIDFREFNSALRELQAQGKTVIMVAQGRTLAGIIALQDTVRESAKESFRELRKIGIEHIVMITGDNQATARAIAEDLDIDEYYAELLPQDKVDKVRVLVDRYGDRVAFVGDGVNDAPALVSATVGIAMGAAGSAAAIETSDIALMSDDLRKLPYSIRLSRRSLRIIKQNIVFALAVIAMLISTALLGWLTLSLGVFGHEGSALIVIANGMRLLRFK